MAASQTPDAGAPKARKRSRWGRRLLIVIVLFAIAGFALTRYAMRQQGPPPSVFQMTLEQNYPMIAKAMSVVASQTPGGASMPKNQLLGLVAKSGFERLDGESLLLLVRLRSQLADSSNTVGCAALWSGDNRNLVPAIEALPDHQQQLWARMFGQTAAAVANGMPVTPAPTPEQFQSALGRIIASLQPAEVEQIKGVVEDPSHQTAADECNAARTLYQAMLKANRIDVAVVARGLL
jgi:hypothetical protein